MKQVLVFVLILAAVYLFYTSYFQKNPEFIVGQVAPLFQVTTPNGQSFTLQDHIGKQVILLNIWATYCPTCREEIPTLNDLYHQMDSKKFQIVSIMTDSAPDDAVRLQLLKRFEQTMPVDFPVYFNSDMSVADAYGTWQIPESYLIGLDGKVFYKHIGAITHWDKESFVKKIQKLQCSGGACAD